MNFTQVVQEFRKFALKGNVVDLAIGVIVGTAFGKIVSSLVDDILMPPIGFLIGGVNFSKLQLVLYAASNGKPDVVISYGVFLQNVVNFIIVAWALFVLVKAMNRLQDQAKPPSATPEEILILREIRDSLRK